MKLSKQCLRFQRWLCLPLLGGSLLSVSGCQAPQSVAKQPPPSSNSAPKVWKNSLGMNFAHLPGGSFRMGDDTREISSPVHEVEVSPFWIGQYEVTNAQFEQFRKRERFPESLTDQQPAVRVTWEEANQFCRWLSKKEKAHYRLPTEAEWEYAARGGLDQKKYPWGDDDTEKHATFGQITTTPVGSHKPNGFGLYDMVGNIDEWVSDWYEPYYYANSPRKDPQGPAKITAYHRVHLVRGGFYAVNKVGCGDRDLWSSELESISGFRVVKKEG